MTTSAKMTSFWFRACETTLLVLVFLLPTAFFLKTYDGMAIKSTIFEVGTIVLAFAWLFKGMERGRWELPETAQPLALPALALLAWTIIRFATAPRQIAALPDFLKQVLCLVTYLIVLLEFGGVQNARRLFGWITAAAWIAGLYGLCQSLGLDPLSWKGAFGQRVFSTLGGPDSLGLFLALCIPLTLAQWLDPERDSFLRWTDMALLLVLLMNIGWTHSFSARFAAQRVCLATALGLPLFFPSRNSLKTTIMCLVMFVIIGMVSFAGGGQPEFFNEWSHGFNAARALISQSPWIGHGPGSFAAAPSQDGGAFLRMIAELGVVGGALWLWLLGSLAAAALGARRRFIKEGALGESCYTAGLCAATLGLLACTQLTPGPRSLFPDWLLWPLAGMLGGLTMLARRGAFVSVLPLPLREAARHKLYAPAFAIMLGLVVFPIRWFDSEIEHNSALACANAGDWQGAIAHFEMVKPGAESFVAAQYGKANAFLALNKPADAINAYAALEDLSPDYSHVHYQKALAYAKLQDWTDAVASHEIESKLNPSFVTNYDAWSQAALKLGDLGAAEVAADKAAELEPSEPSHKAVLAEVYAAERQLAEARKHPTRVGKGRAAGTKKPQG